jgi:hypothetical protein
MATGHQSPQSTLPPLKYKQINTTTWGAGGNTCTITDSYLSTNSCLDIWVPGTVPQAGQWAWTISAGSVTITSSISESSTLPISYVIL